MLGNNKSPMIAAMKTNTGEIFPFNRNVTPERNIRHNIERSVREEIVRTARKLYREG